MPTYAPYLASRPVYKSFSAPPVDALHASRYLPVREIPMWYHGRGTLSGTVKEKGSPDHPVVRRVWLIARDTGIILAETWSAPDGTYSFSGLSKTDSFFVVSFDHTGNYRAVISDNLFAT